jgi:hypothetical protein
MYLTSFHLIVQPYCTAIPLRCQWVWRRGCGETGHAIIILAVDKTQEAVNVLKKNWVRTFGREIYAL